EVLDNRIFEMLLVQAAQRDTTIKVSDAEVDAAIRQEITEMERNFGGGPALERLIRDQLGMSMAEYRDFLSTAFKRNALSQQYVQAVTSRRRPPPVTDAEVREYFEARKAELGQRPTTVTFRQVVVSPQPSEAARTAAMERAREVLDRLRDGE